MYQSQSQRKHCSSSRPHVSLESGTPIQATDLSPGIEDTIEIQSMSASAWMLDQMWGCICDIPKMLKSMLYDDIVPTQEDLRSVPCFENLTFAPGFMDVVRKDSPPNLDFFKSLPTDEFKKWGVYALVLEKPGCRPRLYVGSGTDSVDGVASRFRRYRIDRQWSNFNLRAIQDGYTVTHMGLLCWIPIPDPKSIPITRLFVKALEGTLSFLFWAMRTPEKSGAAYTDYNMTHRCLWRIEDLDWDGLCSHTSFLEGNKGDFELTEEQLIAHVEEYARRHREACKDWHQKQMADNYHDYIDRAIGRVYKSRDQNRENKTWHCPPCGLTAGTKFEWEQHLKTKKHARNTADVGGGGGDGRNSAKKTQAQFHCIPCGKSYQFSTGLSRHRRSDKHKAKLTSLSQTRMRSTGPSQAISTSEGEFPTIGDPDSQLLIRSQSQSQCRWLSLQER